MTERVRRRQLIVNADDLGWSRSVNEGILAAHRDGIVTSTSLLAGGRAFDEAVRSALDTPGLAVGVHLNIYRGTPVLPADQIDSLLGEDGMFPGSWKVTIRRAAMGRLDMRQVEAEFSAAVERVIDAGITPTHLDSEKHLHMWPATFDVVCRVASRYGIPRVRVVRERLGTRAIPLVLSALGTRDARAVSRHGLTCADATIGVTTYPLDVDALKRLLASTSAERVEFVCHPGQIDDEFLEIQNSVPNKMVESREQELATLTHPSARELVEAAGFTLCGTFGQ